MPELPEVETIRRGLTPFVLKKKILKVEVATEKSFVGDPKEVEGAEVIGLRRKGKALLIDLSNGKTLLIHLRMTGQLIWRGKDVTAAQVEKQGIWTEQELAAKAEVKASEGVFAAGHPNNNFTDTLPNKQTRVIFVFSEGKLFFNDQRKFGFVKVLLTGEVEQDKFISELAKEPWEMDVKELFGQCQRHARAPIKAVLLDQKVIAGLGNIYADESLFYAGVHPARRAGELSEGQVELILEGARKVMKASIESGGSTMATYLKPDGTKGDYLEKFAEVFRREGRPCRRCGEVIVKTRVAGRGTHFCPKCQKLANLPGDNPSGKVCVRGDSSV